MKKWWATGAALLLALTYLLNLGSPYAPTNGDEMVYLHIARLTSASGHWLPLVSDLQTPAGGQMRNTKPPLLFWQAMAAGQWGWDLFTLRLPYVAQTLLCAAVVAWFVRTMQRAGELPLRPQAGVQPLSRTLAQQESRRFGKWRGEREWREVVTAPLLAASLYLAFFSTYRYGRPVLTSATESLFLFAVCAWTMVKLPVWRAYPARLLALSSMACGVLMVPALLTKSFVLAAPVGLWLFAALWVSSDDTSKAHKLWHSAWPAALAVATSVAGFALWLALDPDPVGVWREFVVGENFSTKFNNSPDGVLGFWLAPLLNAGLLAPLVLGLCVAAWQSGWRKASTRTQTLLWLWVLAWLVVFSLPSQRSARYVIPVMPAVAALMALYAPRIHRVWWMLTLALTATASLALAWVAWCLNGVFDPGAGYSPLYFAALAAVCAACGVGLWYAPWRIGLTAATGVAWLALLGALAAPFDAASNHYSASVRAQLAGQSVWVPQNFNAQFERFQFSLKTSPRLQALPYEASQGLPPKSADQQGAWAIVLAPFDANAPLDALATRWVLRSRQAPGEVTWAALGSEQGVRRLLVEREVLLMPRGEAKTP